MTSFWKRLAILLGLLTVVGVGVLLQTGWPLSGEALYPKPPFDPWPEDMPKIILVCERPPVEQGPAWEAYVQAVKARNDFLRSEKSAFSQLSEDEKAAIQTLGRDKDYLKAADQAMRVLDKNPRSIAAYWVLSSVEWEYYKNFAGGLFYSQQGRKLCEQAGRHNPADREAMEWYCHLLLQEFIQLGFLGRNEEALQAVEALETFYQPLPGYKIQLLQKLSRYEQAAEAIQAASKQGGWEQTVARGRCFQAAALENRETWRSTCQSLKEALPTNSTIQRMYELSCQATFRFDEALQTVNQPYDWIPIASQRGEIPKAIQQLNLIDRAELKADRSVSLQNRDLNNIVRTLIFLELGRGEEALRFSDQAVLESTRHIDNLVNSEIMSLSARLANWTALQLRIEESRELENASERRRLRLKEWTLRKKIRKLLNEKTLISSIRPYLLNAPGIPTGIPSWMRMTVVDFVAPHIALEAIRLAREAEEHSQAVAYIDAAEARVQLAMGNDEKAFQLAQQAWKGLDRDYEKTLRASVSITAAQAAEHLGQMDQSLEYYAIAIRDWPQGLRIAHVSLPVALQTNKTESRTPLLEAIQQSPRFHQAQEGFPMHIDSQPHAIHCRLQKKTGQPLFEKSFDVSDPALTSLAELKRQLHRAITPPAVELQPRELSQLSGAVSVAIHRGSVEEFLSPILRK